MRPLTLSILCAGLLMLVGFTNGCDNPERDYKADLKDGRKKAEKEAKKPVTMLLIDHDPKKVRVLLNGKPYLKHETYPVRDRAQAMGRRRMIPTVGVPRGERLEVEARPEGGNHFRSWGVRGQEHFTRRVTIVPKEDVLELNLVLAPLQTLTVEFDPALGDVQVVSPAEQVQTDPTQTGLKVEAPSGTPLTLLATPRKGARFHGWLEQPRGKPQPDPLLLLGSRTTTFLALFADLHASPAPGRVPASAEKGPGYLGATSALEYAR